MKLILLHGLGQSPASWNEVISSLPKQIDISCPDLFALCGQHKMHYMIMYHRLEKYLETVSEPIYLCGLSLGAILAMHYTIVHPKKVKALVLIAPQYKMPYIRFKLQNFIFYLLPQSFFKKRGFIKKDLMSLLSSMGKFNFKDKVASISCPTLIICGQKDKANLKASKSLAYLIPHAKLKLIRHAGHEVNKDTPYELARVLYTFYQNKKV